MSSGESNEKESKEEKIEELLKNKNEMLKELFQLRLENENLQADRVESENQAVFLRENMKMMSKGIKLLLEAGGMPDHDTIAAEFERLSDELDTLKTDTEDEISGFSYVIEREVEQATEDFVSEDEIDEKVKTVEEKLEPKVSDLTEKVNEFEGNNAFIELRLDDLIDRVRDLEGRKSKSIMEILLGWVR